MTDPKPRQHPSVTAMWQAYLQSVDGDSRAKALRFGVWHFCDNRADADELANLALAGVKRATAACLWEFRAEPVPRVDDLDVVTFWSGAACCVIRTTQVETVAFEDVSPAFAAREGEGDGSLEYWRRVHWDYYTRVLKPLGRAPSDDMPIVCQAFEVVYPPTR